MGLALAGCAGCSRGDGAPAASVAELRARQARAAAVEAGLPEPVQAFLASAARAPAATFSATYTSGADRVVVHQRPPRRRVDVIGAGGAREAVVVGGDGAVLTCRQDGRRWRCSSGEDRDAALGAFSPELVARTVEALEAAAGSYRTDVGDARLAGVAATCLRSTPLDEAAATTTAQLCVGPDGVPLLLDRGDGSPVLRAIAYRASVRDEDVQRPDRPPSDD